MVTATLVTFGRWIKQQRRLLGLTQADLAQRVPCATVTIRHLEAGRSRPSESLAARLAEVLGLAVHERDKFVASIRAEPGSTRENGRRPPVISPSLISPVALLGRERETAAVRDLLIHQSLTLLTLLGPPGIGKTSLSRQVAYDLRDAYRDGVYWVELAPVQDSALLLPTIAHVLGVQSVLDIPLLESIKTFLRKRRLLLILDNVEHLPGAASDISALLAVVPTVTILATSRSLLHIPEEKVFPVPPLPVPAPTAINIEKLLQCAAVQLFIERAQAINANLALTPITIQAIAAICVRLEGLPLAIELAARRSNLFTPRALLARLSHQLPLLKANCRDLPERQQTLQAAIDWSYALLTPDAQALLNRLGVFLGGFSIESASICFDLPPSRAEVECRLMRLVNQSMISVTTTPSGARRFSMLEMLREYALEHLETSGEAEQMRKRHFDYFLELARRSDTELRRVRQATWVARLNIELMNFRAALGWTVGWQSRTEAGLALAGTLGAFWEIGGAQQEGYQWIARLLTQGGDIESRIHSKALTVAGWLKGWQGDSDTAQLWLAASEALARRTGDVRGLAETLFVQRILYEGADNARARRIMEESLSLSQTVDDPWVLARAQWGLAHVLALDETSSPADLAYARTLDHASEKTFREFGDRWMLMFSRWGLGRVAEREGKLDEAYDQMSNAADDARTAPNPWALVLLLNNLAAIAHHLKRFDLVYTHCEEAYLHSAGLVGARRRYIILRFADAALDVGNRVHAVDLYREYLEYSYQNHFPTGVVMGIMNLIWVALEHCSTGKGLIDVKRQLLGQGYDAHDTHAVYRYAATLLGAVTLLMEGVEDPEVARGVLPWENREAQVEKEWDASRGFVVFAAGMYHPDMVRDWHLWKTTVQDILEPQTFAIAFARGKSLLVEQVVELALQGL